MRWYPDRKELHLNNRDYPVFAQCGEHPRSPRECWPIIKIEGPVPVPSKLRYVMLVSGHGGAYFWMHYRSILALARNHDRYYREVSIPKRSGGYRVLALPGEKLAEQQRLFKYLILSGIPADPHACAYERGRSIRMCAEPHVGKSRLIHLDIKDFFGSITQSMVRRMFTEYGGYSAGVAKLFSDLCCYKGHLPQGTCTSPQLSNLCFRRCDELIAEYAEYWGWNYTRYSDDLYFSAPRQLNLDGYTSDRLIQKVSEILCSEGFRLNEKKTSVRCRGQAQRVLGISVNPKIQATRDYRRDVRQEYYYWSKFGRDALAARRHSDSYLSYLHALLGKVSYILYLNPKDSFFKKARITLNYMIMREEN